MSDKTIKGINTQEGVATFDYESLANLPKINGQELKGDINIEGGSGGGITDVKINDTSIVENGIANIPVASGNYGVARIWNAYGVSTVNGYLSMEKATNTNIDSRDANYKAIVPTNLDYAVKKALCDGKGQAWTSEEKASARERLGLGWHLVDTIEVTEEVAQAQIDFPQEYSEFMVIADISGSGSNVIYPLVGYTRDDGYYTYKSALHSDFYPSDKNEHLELIFEKMNIENDTYFRMSGFEKTDFAKTKLKQNVQTTGWTQEYDTSNTYQCHCWQGVKFTRTITSATFKLFAR